MQVSQMKRAVSQAQWKQRIVECRNSGDLVKEWCRKQGISYSTYYRHEQALLKSTQEPSDIAITEPVQQALSVPFVEVPGICQVTAKTHPQLRRCMFAGRGDCTLLHYFLGHLVQPTRRGYRCIRCHRCLDLCRGTGIQPAGAGRRHQGL